MISVKEGAYLFENGVNPYDGDMYHKSPLILLLTSQLIKCYSAAIPYIFVMLDILTGVLLYIATKRFINEMVSYLP